MAAEPENPRKLLELAAKAAGYTQLGTLFKLGSDGGSQAG